MEMTLKVGEFLTFIRSEQDPRMLLRNKEESQVRK